MSGLVRWLGCALCLGAVLSGPPAWATPAYARINKLFNGTGGAGTTSPVTYHSYRIPSLVTGYNNTLFLFCEAHLNTASDWGTPIDLVFRKSTDGGVNWGSLVIIAGAANSGAGARGWTNPTAVYEPTWTGGPAMGRIHLFFNWHAEAETGLNSLVHGDVRIYYTYSDDNGATWAARQNLTSTLNPAGTAWAQGYDNVGPGNGIRRTLSPVGQLVVPALSRNFYSTDHGANWTYRRAPLSDAAAHPGNEGTIVECSNGALMRNDRPKGAVFLPPASPGDADGRRRWISYGTIEGDFSAYVPDDDLFDPKCEGSILRYNFNSPQRIIFLNSSSVEDRGRMKVRISYNDGTSWDRSRFLYSGTPPDNHPNVEDANEANKGGYSSMTKHVSSGIVAAVEISEAVGSDHYDDVTKARSIDLHRFNIEWILNGELDGPNP